MFRPTKSILGHATYHGHGWILACLSFVSSSSHFTKVNNIFKKLFLPLQNILFTYKNFLLWPNTNLTTYLSLFAHNINLFFNFLSLGCLWKFSKILSNLMPSRVKFCTDLIKKLAKALDRRGCRLKVPIYHGREGLLKPRLEGNFSKSKSTWLKHFTKQKDGRKWNPHESVFGQKSAPYWDQESRNSIHFRQISYDWKTVKVNFEDACL